VSNKLSVVCKTMHVW